MRYLESYVNQFIFIPVYSKLCQVYLIAFSFLQNELVIVQLTSIF